MTDIYMSYDNLKRTGQLRNVRVESGFGTVWESIERKKSQKFKLTLLVIARDPFALQLVGLHQMNLFISRRIRGSGSSKIPARGRLDHRLAIQYSSKTFDKCV